jgi:hypothetical protein
VKVNQENVNNLVRAVDILIQLNNYSHDLDEATVDELISKALTITSIDFTSEELEAVKRDITWKYKIYTTPGQSIVDDYEQVNWYDDRKSEIQPVFWSRYKNYLIDDKKFSPNVVTTLGEETLDSKLMNYIGDPTSVDNFFKRGLIIGDVQSGKTSTYIGFICKAADAGYKVFILLTGTIESLRKQTQERVEEGVIGINLSADITGGQRVGVGLDNKPIHAMAMTSRIADFTGNSDKIAVSLSDKQAVVFVIKKNTTVLKKLKDWLVSLNADPGTGRIDVPMLLIDDEADNASINTNADKEDPTKINKLIRELSSVFTKSNYVGFTATPFANVFIDPETTEDMETQDLFPEDFIVALPTPSNYIGPKKIFAEEGMYHTQLVDIEDAGREEIDGWPFYFKHNKNWEEDLPESLTDSIYTFYLANAIRDLRGDSKEHRSMLINVSRFVKVQYYIKSEVEELHGRAYRSIKFNLSDDFDVSMKDPIIRRIYEDWEKHYSSLEFDWNDIAEKLFESIENIQIKVVNSSRNSEKLEYPKNEALRVITIGGLALSRGLTLEGLITSYFYRNTCTYDVLMQMGRWFGYRKGYDDLFRIWTHKDSADWYSEIAEATETLKQDMSIMREQGLKPKNFGIRVRNNCTELKITANNKMRNAADEYDYLSYFGGIVETPYLIYNSEAQKNNYNVMLSYVDKYLSLGCNFDKMKIKGTGEHYIIQDVPKIEILEFLKKMKVSKFSSNFDVGQIVDFMSNCGDSLMDLWDVAFMDGDKSEDTEVDIFGRKIYKVKRNNCIFDKETERLSIGRKGKLGGPNDGLMGIIEMNGKSSEDIIEEAKKKYRTSYKIEKGIEFSLDKTYTSDTWFKYVYDRKPIIIIYLIDVDTDTENQKAQAKQFMDAMNGIPVVGLALGLPNNENAVSFSRSKYKANKIYNWFDRDTIIAEGEEE